MSAELYADGAVAAEHILADVYRLDVAKARDPLDDRDFLAIVQRFARVLAGVARGAEAKALREALVVLDVDWAALTPAARERVVRAARASLDGLGAQILPRIDHVFAVEAPALVATSRRATTRRFGLHIQASTMHTDARIAAFVRRSEGLFIRDQYGRRQDELAQRARDVVATGLAQGLGRDDIASQLAAKLGPTVSRGMSYWQVVAMSFANRGRTYAQLAAFEDAGIERFRFEAVLDQVTSNVCRFMHGRVFTVERAMQRFDDVERASDPAQIADLQPWMRTGADDDGHQVLFYERAGQRHPVARVAESAVGTSDRTGRYSHALTNDQLEAAGLMTPPLHGRCRSTLVTE